MGVAECVEIKQGHVQLLVNDAIRMLQGARLYESAVFASVHQMNRLAARAKIAIFIDADLAISFAIVVSCLIIIVNTILCTFSCNIVSRYIFNKILILRLVYFTGVYA